VAVGVEGLRAAGRIDRIDLRSGGSDGRWHH
jgi:hypothetical protein